LCVLLVRFSSIGDIVLTTPLVRALARRHPEAKLVYVTKRAMAPLVADNPHLAEVVALEPDEPLRHLARRLSALAGDQGRQGRAGARDRLLPLPARLARAAAPTSATHPSRAAAPAQSVPAAIRSQTPRHPHRASTTCRSGFKDHRGGAEDAEIRWQKNPPRSPRLCGDLVVIPRG